MLRPTFGAALLNLFMRQGRKQILLKRAATKADGHVNVWWKRMNETAPY